MAGESAPPEELLAARRAIESLEGVSLLEDWKWYARGSQASPGGWWVLRCLLSPSNVKSGGPVPASTDWYVLVEPTYPWGSIEFYPAKEGGIPLTFPHQDYNAPGDPTVPWRMGKPCLDTQVRVLGRRAYDEEPYGVHERLRWRFERALGWLEAASRDELLLPGEPFELPQVRSVGGWDFTMVFREGPETLAAWQDLEERAGAVDLVQFGPEKSFLVVDRFLGKDGGPLQSARWGRCIEDASEQQRMRGIWLRLDSVPVLYPWQHPVTWGELREVCRSGGQSLDDLLNTVAVSIRDGSQHSLLIGFPIPTRVGETVSRMHWYAAMLPALSWGNATYPGFRPGTELAYQRRDRAEILADSVPVGWQHSENWHPDDASARGRLSEGLRSKEILLVGAGAIGSAVAELLVRGGASNALIIDGDRLEAGNLVRHTLGLDDLHENKAVSLARQLNLASPHARVGAIEEHFPPTDEKDRRRVLRRDLVLDCTGEDPALRHLELFPWEEERLFVSLSLGLGAKSLYCFVSCGRSFPLEAYREAVDPHLRRQLDLYADTELPRGGAGCWHPLFPGRADDLWPMAAAAVKIIEAAAEEPPCKPELVVFERMEEGGTFAGIRRVGLPDDA
jgi:hypothetical protein